MTTQQGARFLAQHLLARIVVASAVPMADVRSMGLGDLDLDVRCVVFRWCYVVFLPFGEEWLPPKNDGIMMKPSRG